MNTPIEPERAWRDARELLRTPPPAPSAKARVRAAVDERIAGARRFQRTCAYFLATTVAALVVVALVNLRLAVPATGSASIRAALRPKAEEGGNVFELPSGARVVVRPGSEVGVERDDAHGTHVRLSSGQIVVNVDKRGPSRPFIVFVGDTSVRVLGTTFAVAQRSDGTAVHVIEGTVEVARGLAATKLSAGRSWPLGSASASIDVTLRDLSLLFGTQEAGSLPSLASLSAPVGDAASSPSSPKPVDALSPGSVRPSAPFAGEALPSTSPTGRTPVPASSVRVPRDAPVKAAEAETASAEVLYRKAKDLERRGELGAAREAYTAAAVRAGPYAEDALFALGRTRVQTHGDPAAAIRAFQAYRARYPSGRYAREVDVHLLDLFLRVADTSRVLEECGRFLASYPADPRAFRFRLARAAVVAGRGDCNAALDELALVPDEASAPVRRLCDPRRGR